MTTVPNTVLDEIVFSPYNFAYFKHASDLRGTMTGVSISKII